VKSVVCSKISYRYMANCRENMMLSRKQEVHPHFVADNRLVQRSQASAPVMCCCMDQFILQLFGALGLSGTCLSPKLPYPLWELSPLHNTLFIGPSPLIIPNSILSVQLFLYGSQMLCCTMHC